MIDRSLLEKFYSKIFTIPRKRISVSLGVITIVFASILNGMVSKTFFAQRYFFIGLALIILLLIFSKFIKLAFNSKRIFFLALLILIFIEIFDFIVIHLGFFELIVLSPASLSTLLTLVLYFTSEVDSKKVAFSVLTILMLLYPVDYHYSFTAPHRMLSYTIASIVGVSLALLYIKYIDKDFDGVNMRELLKSFILFWLTTEPKYFEEKLEKVSEIKKGFVKCLKIGKVKLVSTSFHPGPIRNVGGAKLVRRILEDPYTIYMHSPTKHELNPSTTEDVEKIVKAIKCCDVDCKSKKPIKVSGKRYTLYCFPFECVNLIIFSGNDVTDDMSPEINELAENELKKFGDTIVVEAHNAHKDGFEFGTEEFYEVCGLLKSLKLELEKEFENCELNTTFEKKKVETNNICGWIAAIVLSYKDDLDSKNQQNKYCILMVDGNNIVKEFRDEMVAYARSMGVELIFISTDNHSKTGISPKVGYKPVGSDKSDRIAVKSFLDDVLRRSEEDKAKVKYGKSYVNIKVMGKRFFESVEKGFIELGEKALYLFWICIIFQMSFTALLGLFLIEV